MTWFMQSWEKNYEYKEMMGINVFLGDLNAATMVGDVLRMGIDLNIELPSGSNKVAIHFDVSIRETWNKAKEVNFLVWKKGHGISQKLNDEWIGN